MHRKLAWMCVIGGLLWGIKPIYDVLFNGRRMNTGYTPSDTTDYVSFIFPLLCIAGLTAVYSLYRGKVRNSVAILIVSVVLTACFHFFEIYYYGSNLPFGFIFLFFGTVLMMAGSLYLFVQLRKAGGAGSLLPWAAILIFADNVLLIVLAFLTEALPEAITNPVMGTLMVAIGFIWAVLGLGVLRVLPGVYVPHQRREEGRVI